MTKYWRYWNDGLPQNGDILISVWRNFLLQISVNKAIMLLLHHLALVFMLQAEQKNQATTSTKQLENLNCFKSNLFFSNKIIHYMFDMRYIYSFLLKKKKIYWQLVISARNIFLAQIRLISVWNEFLHKHRQKNTYIYIPSIITLFQTDYTSVPYKAKEEKRG